MQSFLPIISPGALAFVTAGVLHLLALRVFPRLGLLDFPERYGLMRKRLPYPTGILSVLTFLPFFLLLQPWSDITRGVVIGVTILALFCIRDDRQPLSPLLRIAVQLGVALYLFTEGARIFSITNPLEGFMGGRVLELDTFLIPVPFLGSISLFGALFTMLWLGLTINALNWFDGIPGQVTTISTIAFLTLGFLSLSDRVNDPDLARVAFVLAGISAAALLFDFPPPRVVLGDTGAMFFGLMVGLLTIHAGKGKVATAFLVLGVPLIDSIIVGLRRLLSGRSPLRGGRANEHLHHRLLSRGWSPRQIILLTASIGTAFGIAALFMETFEKFLSALALGVIMMALSWYSRPKSRNENTRD